MKRVLVVEDEPVVARRLERITKQAIAGVETAVAASLSEAVRLAGTCAYELVLLDLNLSGDDGFALINRIPGPVAVIVVSASPERAIEAFDHEVVDFVAKPFSEARLRAALERAEAKLSNLPSRTLAVRVRAGWRYVRLSEIDHVRAADDYCELVLIGGERLLHAMTLERLAAVLPSSFRRVHRSAIVNLRTASGLRRRASGGLAIVTGEGCLAPVGRSYAAALTVEPWLGAPSEG